MIVRNNENGFIFVSYIAVTSVDAIIKKFSTKFFIKLVGVIAFYGVFMPPVEAVTCMYVSSVDRQIMFIFHTLFFSLHETNENR
jgi:hypothetical protein